MMAGATFEQVRRIALGLPGAEEVSTWGTETVFQVGGKMFAVAAPDESHATVKSTPEEQATLVAGDPDTYAVAPTTGRFGWVRVELARIDPPALRALVVAAWRSAAPRRLTASYDAEPT
jgi:hypothetical protein